jgi:hypothetical protein
MKLKLTFITIIAAALGGCIGVKTLGASPEAFDQTNAKNYVRNFFSPLQKPACSRCSSEGK